VSNDMYTTQQV